MSFNGSGTFQINSAGQPVVAGTVITAAAFNALTADLATGLSTCMTKDGQTSATANIPMGNNKFTGLSAGTAATDSTNLGQVQGNVASLISVAGIDTITGSMSPTLTAYTTGAMYWFVAAGTNTGAVTLNIDGLGAKSVTRDGSTALIAGDIVNGQVAVVVYDGTRFQLQKANAFGTLTATTINTTNLTATGTVNLTGATVSNGGSVTTIDINGGTVDGVTIGGASAGAATFTNLTASGTINFTGATVSNLGSVTTADINGGTVDGVTIGGASAGAGTFTNLTASGTINFTGATVSNGGSVTTVDINGGTIDGAIIGGASAAAGTFTTATVGAGLVGTPSLTTAGDTNTGIYFPAADTIAVATSGTERMRIDNAGNVGIATTSPSSFGKFAVQGASNTRAFYADALAQPVARYDDNSYVSNGLTIRNTGISGSNQGIGLLFQLGAGGTAVDSGAIQMRSEADYSTAANQDAAMAFFTAANGTNSERMRIDSSGNVGIGTSSPAYRLDLNGALRMPNATVLWMNDSTGAAKETLQLYSDNNTYFSTPTALIFRTNGTTERMRIASAGEVGIGTSSPTAFVPLTILSNSGNAIAQNIRGRSDGIGVLLFSDNSDVENGRLDFRTNYAEIRQARNAPLVLSTNATERMRIDGSGNVVAGGSVALATTATNGFLYVPTCAGTPTGTPTAITGMAPIVVNTTNNKLYFYSGGAWRDAGP